MFLRTRNNGYGNSRNSRPKAARTLTLTPKARNTSFIPGKKKRPMRILGSTPIKVRNHKTGYSGVHGDSSGNVMW